MLTLRSLQLKPPLARTIAPLEPAATRPTSPAQTVNNPRVVGEAAACQLSNALALNLLVPLDRMVAHRQSAKPALSTVLMDTCHHKPFRNIWEGLLNFRQTLFVADAVFRHNKSEARYR